MFARCKNPIKSDLARNTERTGKPGAPMHTLTTKDRHGVLCEGIRRLTPRANVCGCRVGQMTASIRCCHSKR